MTCRLSRVSWHFPAMVAANLVLLFAAQNVLPGSWTTSPGLANSNLWEYDPVANSWATKASMPTLSACAPTRVINGKLYVTTACNGYSGYFNFLHVWDPATNGSAGTISDGTCFATGRCDHRYIHRLITLATNGIYGEHIRAAVFATPITSGRS